jgi:hypothetical protein
MHVRRGLLFAGLFLIPLGGMTLLVRAGVIDASSLVDVWKFWPLILIGFGIALLLGRSRVASVGTAIAALVLGVLVGGVVASGTLWIGSFADCGSTGNDTQHLDKSGTFGGPAAVHLDLRCGSVALTTRAGQAWQVGAAYEGPPPTITDTTDGLEVRVPDVGGVRHNDWTVAVGSGALHELRAETNAATGSFTLADAHLDALDVKSNAGDVVIDGTAADIAILRVDVNAGRARVTLAGGATGGLSVNAGAIDLCADPQSNLRFTVNDQLTFVTNLASRGLQQDGTTWTRTVSPGAPLIDLTVDGNAASFTLDPDGGCR